MLENLKSLVWTGGGQGILFAVVVYVVAGLVGFKSGFQCFELSGVSSPSFVLVNPLLRGRECGTIGGMAQDLNILHCYCYDLPLHVISP